MSEHTPGEWFLGDVQPWNSEQEIKSTERLDYHAAVQVDTDEGKANARLIAAAPELLEALTQLYATSEKMEGIADSYWEKALRDARNAIAKAERREHGG